MTLFNYNNLDLIFFYNCMFLTNFICTVAACDFNTRRLSLLFIVLARSHYDFTCMWETLVYLLVCWLSAISEFLSRFSFGKSSTLAMRRIRKIKIMNKIMTCNQKSRRNCELYQLRNIYCPPPPPPQHTFTPMTQLQARYICSNELLNM